MAATTQSRRNVSHNSRHLQRANQQNPCGMIFFLFLLKYHLMWISLSSLDFTIPSYATIKGAKHNCLSCVTFKSITWVLKVFWLSIYYRILLNVEKSIFLFFKNLYLHLPTLEDICSKGKSCLQFCQNSMLYQWLKTLLSFFAFFVFSKNFSSKVCVFCILSIFKVLFVKSLYFCILCIFKVLFVKSLCFLHSLYFQRTFCQKSVFFNSLYFQSIFCQKSVLTVVGFARNWRWPPRLRRETTTSWRPLVEIVSLVSLCFAIVEIVSLCSCH